MLIVRTILAIVLATALMSWGVYKLGPLPNTVQTTQTKTEQERNDKGDEKQRHSNSGDSLTSFIDWLTHDAAGFFTFALVVVGGFQLALFWVQLHLIRKSLIDAKTAANAAKEAAEIAKRSFTELERPWLFIEGATVSRREIPPESMIPNNWFIVFRCRNVGRSPAVVQECIIKFVDRDIIPAVPDYTNPIQLETQRWASPDQPFDTKPPIGPSPTTGTKNGKAIEFIVYGRITYTELNGAVHHTGFAVAVSPHMAAFSGYPNDAYDYYD
jgi:hypothetical protein